jgi:hypothetical protein
MNVEKHDITNINIKQKKQMLINGTIPVYYTEEDFKTVLDYEIKQREKLLRDFNFIDKILMPSYIKKIKQELEELKLCETEQGIRYFFSTHNSNYTNISEILDFLHLLDGDSTILDFTAGCSETKIKIKYLDTNGYVKEKTLTIPFHTGESIHPDHYVIEFNQYKTFHLVFYKQIDISVDNVNKQV